MSVVKIAPTDARPMPFDLSDEEPSTFVDEIRVAGSTAELQAALGASITVDPEDQAETKSLLKEALKKQSATPLKHPQVAIAALAFLRQYGAQVALDVASIRSAITHKLMELANCGDPKHELRALELLGKHSDIGLFTERSEITVNYRSPEALEEAIKERIKRLLNADVIDITPLSAELEGETGYVSKAEAAARRASVPSLSSELEDKDDLS